MTKSEATNHIEEMQIKIDEWESRRPEKRMCIGKRSSKSKKHRRKYRCADDIFETAGDGASFDSSEMQIPFVRILQPMSPQLKKGKAEHIEGVSQVTSSTMSLVNTGKDQTAS